MDSQKLCISCCLLTTSVVILSVFILFSLDALAYNQVGLNYSTWFKKMDTETYTNGFHFLGLGREFITFDKTYQTVEFSTDSDADYTTVNCRTSEGIIVQLEFSFQYQVDTNKLSDIFLTYGDDVRTVIIRTAIDAVNVISVKYDYKQYFTDRISIQGNMTEELNSTIYSTTYHTVPLMQMRSITLPDELETEIQNTQVAAQDILTADAELVLNEIEQNTTVIVANMTQIVNSYDANATAVSTEYSANYTANATLEYQNLLAEGYNYMLNMDLGGSSLTTDQLNSIIEYQLIRDNTEGNGIYVSLT